MENEHSLTALPSSIIFSGISKSISIPPFGFIIWAELKSKQYKHETIFRRFEIFNPPLSTAD